MRGIFEASSTYPTQTSREKSKTHSPRGAFWPHPILQFNPAYEQAGTTEAVIASRLLHDDVRHIFDGYSLYRHQREAIELGVGGTE